MDDATCLDENVVAELVDGVLSAPARALAERHLEHCADCRAMIHHVAAAEGRDRRGEPSVTLQLADRVGVDASSTTTRDSEPPPSSGTTALAPGEMVDHFRVQRMLGRGGMGEVYLARDTTLGRRVALKVVRARIARSPQALEHFMHEARTTATFSHPNIVTIHAVGQHLGVPYVALEYIEGQTLRQRLDERLPSPSEALRIALAIAEALVEAHRHGILHRDLKPANVLIGQDGRVRVVDFGLAVSETAESAPPTSAEGSDSQRTPRSSSPLTWRPVGTPRYMAPEQWRGDACSAATDVWALGTIVHLLLTGEQAFPESSVDTLAAAVCLEPLAGLHERGHLSPDMIQLIERCLEKDPQARPSSASVAESLRDLLYRGQRDRPELESPFRGLLPFRERHASMFFGRDAEVAGIVEQIRTDGVLGVIGPSGAGKSSFVQAAVIPRLKEQRGWCVLSLRPRSQPFHALATALLQSDVGDDSDWSETPSDQNVADVASLKLELLERPGRLGNVLREVAARQGVHVLLFVDQLEEVFTMAVDEPSVPRGEIGRRFIDAIYGAGDDPADPVRIVFTLRDDFLGRLATVSRGRSALSRLWVLETPEPRALAEILTRPLELVDHRYEDPEMVNDMVEAVKGEPACLPLLQFVAHSLWEQRDRDRRVLKREQYDRLGGVAGALARHADGVVAAMSGVQREIARAVLLRLVTPERTRRVLTVRRALEGLGAEPATGDKSNPRASFGSGALAAALGASPADKSPHVVLWRLVDARLLTASKTGDDATDTGTLEIVHESLIDGWPTLSRWIDESREELTFFAELEQAAELWDKRGRRPEELWQRDALGEAQRTLARIDRRPVKVVSDFLEAASTRQRRRTWRARAAVLGSIALLVAIAIVLAFQKREADQQRQRAEEREVQVQKKRAEALLEGARGAYAAGRVLEARAKLRLALELEDSAGGRALWWQLAREPLIWKRALGAAAYTASFSPDGRHVAVGSLDHTVRVLDAVTSEERVFRGHTDQVRGVAFSPDGRRIASRDLGGMIRLWDFDSGAAIRVMKDAIYNDAVVAYDPSGRLIATGTDESVRLWDASSGKLEREVSAGGKSVRAVAFSPRGEWVAANCFDKKIRVWSVATGEKSLVIDGAPPTVRTFSFSPDGESIASAGTDDAVRIWSTKTGHVTRAMAQHDGTVRAVVYSPDGKLVASVGVDRSVRIWEVDGAMRRASLLGHESAVWGAAFDGRTSVLVTSGADGTVRAWDVEAAMNASSTGENVPHGGHSDMVNDAAFRTDGSEIASVSEDNSIRVWDTATGALRATLPTQAPNLRWIEIGGVDLMLVSGDYGAELWRKGDRRAFRTDLARRACFSPDARSIALGGDDVRLWDVATGSQRQLEVAASRVEALAWSPDGRRLATGYVDGSVRLWDLNTSRATQAGTPHALAVSSLAFSPDGKTLASAAYDGTVHLWVPEGGKSNGFSYQPARVWKLAFHPDGHRLGLALSDGTARLRDLRSGSEVVLRGARGEVNSIDFSPSGALAVAAGDDRSVRLWETDSGRPRWRGSALLGSPARAYTHRGVAQLDAAAGAGALRTEGGPALGAALMDRARWAEVGEGSRTLCMSTHDGQIEVWNLDGQEPLAHAPVDRPEPLAAVADACISPAPGGVQILRASGERVAVDLGAEVTALGASSDIVAAAGSELILMNADGAVTARHRTDPGITALAFLSRSPGDSGRMLAIGYRDGNVEISSLKDGSMSGQRKLADVPASGVTRILAGSRGSIVAGFASGELGLWDGATGERYWRGQLHGGIAHLLIERGKLYALSELGAYTTQDIRALDSDYCTLMRELWARVPVVWEAGRATAREPPAEHACAQR